MRSKGRRTESGRQNNPCNHAGGHGDGIDRLGGNWMANGTVRAKTRPQGQGHGHSVGQLLRLEFQRWGIFLLEKCLDCFSNPVQYGLVAWQSCFNWQVGPPTDKSCVLSGRVKNLSTVKRKRLIFISMPVSVTDGSKMICVGAPTTHGLLPTPWRAGLGSVCWNVSRYLALGRRQLAI